MADAPNNAANNQRNTEDTKMNTNNQDVTIKEEPVPADVLEEDDEFEEFQDDGMFQQKSSYR